MEQLHGRIREISEKISGAEMGRKRLAGFLKASEAGSGYPLSLPVAKAALEKTRLAGVDGGLVKRSLHGFDFVLARAAGVCFSYSNGKMSQVEYHPARMPEPELFVLEAHNEIEWAHASSIIRQKTEIRTAIESAEKFRPDMLLLDGPLIPHYSERPAKNSKARESYDELISLYNRLFSACSAKGVMLAGVVEDSRGRRFCEIAAGKIAPKTEGETAHEMKKALENSRDTAILYWMLEEGERTFAFPYADVSEDHPLAKEFGSFAGRMFSFYLKTAKFDRPVRVDFLGEEKDADKFAGLILAISSHHSGYGFPSVLIEADQAAKLSENDIDHIYEQVVATTGSLPGAFRLRRDSRPF